MQKIHKSKTPKVYKNKKLNNANFGTYNLNDYQVFLQLVSKLGKVDINGTYQQPQDLEREHVLTAKEFSQAFGIDLNTSYGVLKRASNRLARTAITLEKPELFEIWDIPVCEISKYNTKDGSITVTFSNHIMPYLAQVRQKFVLYNLKEIANFGSLYSTRLYELIQEFKDTGYIIKSVTQLREIFAVGKKFPDYNNFKRYTFAHAVDEINAQYEINLRFEELKEGRRVVSIRFEFIPSHKVQGYNPTTKQMVNITVKPKRKTKQDDDSTPPPVHPDQQELPLLVEKEEPRSTLQKVVKKMVSSKYAEKNYAPSIKKLYEKTAEEGLTKENLKTYATERKEEIKQSMEDVKAIIAAFMKKGLTEAEAKIKAIELDLI
jgi:plasmid replication initiation protein